MLLIYLFKFYVYYINYFNIISRYLFNQSPLELLNQILFILYTFIYIYSFYNVYFEITILIKVSYKIIITYNLINNFYSKIFILN